MAIALIPARAGSKRIPNKNVKLFSGEPLVVHTIKKALASGIFESVIVSTESPEIAELSTIYGASVPGLRPPKFAEDSSPDIDWVRYAIENWFQHLSIETPLILLRPTNPFRKNSSIKEALSFFLKSEDCDSLRAIKKVSEHPGKMWRKIDTKMIIPYLAQQKGKVPTHSSPTQSLEELYVQSAAMEIFTIKMVKQTDSIAGQKIIGYEMSDLESLDLNTMQDWHFMQYLATTHPTLLEE